MLLICNNLKLWDRFNQKKYIYLNELLAGQRGIIRGPPRVVLAYAYVSVFGSSYAYVKVFSAYATKNPLH